MRMTKRTKRFFAAAALLSLSAGMTFAETHELVKAHTLESSAGTISFGAWGRSTFELGHSNSSTKVTVDMTSLATSATASAESDIAAYEAAKSSGTLSAVNAAVSALGAEPVGTVDLADDQSNIAAYGAAVATYKGYKAAYDAYAGGNTDTAAVLGIAQSEGSKSGENFTKYATAKGLMAALEAFETDTSSSKNFAGLNPDWSYGSRVGFWIIGRTPDEKFGFDFNLDSDARALFVHKLWDSTEDTSKINYNEDGKYAVAIGDQAKIWAKMDNPLFQTKVSFGRMRENELRGKIGDFGQRESGDVKSEDDIFQEIWTATGLFASVKGNEDSVLKGFYANAAIDLAGNIGELQIGNDTIKNDSAADKDSSQSVGMYDAFRTAQAGIGYTVPGLLQVKAQYWGDSIAASNYRYEASKYQAARSVGYDMNDYYGRMEFGIDWLGFMGGASSLGDLDLEKNPNAALIELGVKVPIVTREGLRDYDPEKFYNWYSCLGAMGVIQKGFILYKGHLWGGQGTSNLGNYTDISGSGSGLLTMEAGDGANIFMAGADFLAEVCLNPFGKQDVFLGLSGNYNITSASADGKALAMGQTQPLALNDLELRQHNIGAEIYVKKTFGANNYLFAGIAERFSLSSMDGNVEGLVDLSYTSKNNKFYMPIGIEMFF
ncbi:hypothetical protein [Treponema saccharophilum]|uniref:Major outer membrane protein n=1 Tax=Treponema saccharophilum DSM 2985 TaxID=907348 RepID=H7EKM4_9SPIR|nr:hypothetical protein [Treponema saccharophilum]EIC01929.1 hypothetical protein TresaDRAFT_1681 [Treponema saccharophilum DSM 2985]BDC97468.1 hypothetical protein TRSA_25670 [Treponema saccharophilum]